MYVVSMIFLALLIIVFISIAKVYRSIPLVELKRRARANHEPAKSLYRVASYQHSAQFVLLLLATIASAAFFVVLARRSPIWVALTADAALIWFAYIWIPRSSVNIVSQYLAQVCAKPLAWLLQYIHPYVTYFHKKLTKPTHTGLYERSDVVRLLTAQRKQEDNRMEEFEIDFLKHVIDFGDTRVLDIMTPKRKVRAVSASETLGPIVLSELHKTGGSYFPVYEGKTSNIVGILNISGLSATKQTLGTYEAMSQLIYYVHEEQSLGEVLQAMIQTSQEMFIVINSSQDYLGVITARDILKNLVGEPSPEVFDKYDDKELVANRFVHIEPEEEEVVIVEEPIEEPENKEEKADKS